MIINNRDVIEDLKSYPDFNFNTIFADPPYQLGTEWQIDLTSGKVVPVGHIQEFMGKKWGVDWQEFFVQAYRVLKHGGYCCLFCIDRQTLPLEYYATMAGFEITQHLYWFNLAGFPKSLNVSKAIDWKLGEEREVIGTSSGPNNSTYKGERYKEKRKTKFGDVQDQPDKTAPSSPLAKQYEGYHAGIAPMKPCMEIVLVFRKPTKSGNYIDDIITPSEDASPAVLNIDGERVGIEKRKNSQKDTKDWSGNSWGAKPQKNIGIDIEVDGRYPSQLYVNPEAAEKLDKQSGEFYHGERKNPSTNKSWFGDKTGSHIEGKRGYEDIGGASKILHVCDYDKEELELIYYCPKVSGHERNAGCEDLAPKPKTGDYEGCDTRCSVCGKYFLSGDNPCKCDEEEYGSKAERAVNPTFSNPHPTLKPMKLIWHLAKLFKLPESVNQKVYIPFSGAGSEIIGFLAAGYKKENLFTCEINPDYVIISEARIKYWEENDFYFIKDKEEQATPKERSKKNQSLNKTFKKMF